MHRKSEDSEERYFSKRANRGPRLEGGDIGKGKDEGAKKYGIFDRMSISSSFNLPEDRSTVGRRRVDALNIVHSSLSQVHGRGKQAAEGTALCEGMERLGKRRERIMRVNGLANKL